MKDQNLLQRGKLSLGVKVVRSLFHGKVYTFMKQVYDQAFNEDQVRREAMCWHHVIPFIHPLYTYVHPLYTTYTPLNTSKQPLNTLNTPTTSS